MTKSKIAFVAVMMLGLASPAFSAPISQHRAEAIQQCQNYADSKYGPSGGHDWRRFDHDTYAACMFDAGEPE